MNETPKTYHNALTALYKKPLSEMSLADLQDARNRVWDFGKEYEVSSVLLMLTLMIHEKRQDEYLAKQEAEQQAYLEHLEEEFARAKAEAEAKLAADNKSTPDAQGAQQPEPPATPQ